MMFTKSLQPYDGFVQDCSVSIAHVLQMLQSYTEPQNSTEMSIEKQNLDGLAQDCGNSSAYALELPQSFT